MIFDTIFTLFILFLIGYLFKIKNILKKEDSKIFADLLIYLVIPVLIIDSFSTIKLESSLIYLPISALIVIFSLIILGYLFARILKLKDKTRGAFIITFPTLEGGIIGYAVMLSVFGEIGLSRIVLFDFMNAIILFTVIYFLSCRFGNNDAKLKDSILKLIKMPLIWAIIIGLTMNVMGVQQSGFISNLFDVIGGSVIVLGMLLLGLEFKPNLHSFKLPVIGLSLKMFFGMLLGLAVSSLFGLDGVERIAVIIGSSLPPSIMTLVFSEENKLDTEYTANIVSIGLFFSFILISLLLYFFPV